MSTSAVQAPNSSLVDDAVPSARAIAVCRRIGWACGLVTAAAGAMAVLSDAIRFYRMKHGTNDVLDYMEKYRVLDYMEGKFRIEDLPTALTTGLAFLLSGAALALLVGQRRRFVQGILARLAIWPVVLWSVYDLAAWAIDELSQVKLPTDANLSSPFNDPPMSPFTALIFLIAGLGILFVVKKSERLRCWSSGLALVIALLSGVALLGYAHGVELFQKILKTPMALYTALIFAVLSVGLVCVIGPKHFPISVFLGVRTQARLLRTFLPVVLGIVLFDALLRSYVEGQEASETLYSPIVKALSQLSEEKVSEAIQDVIGKYPDLPNWKNPKEPLDKKPWGELKSEERLSRCIKHIQYQRKQSHSLLSAFMAVFAVFAAIVAISYISRIIGNTIDAAERSRDQALRDMCASRDETKAANERLRKNNEELSRARDAAETAVRTKGRFLANMNHELRTPLNSIILYAEEVMIEHEGETALVADLQVILDRGKHLIALINDILDYTKLEENRVKLEPTSFAVPEMARDVAVTIEPLAKKNGNKLCVECAPEVGAMHADVVRVKQCLLNLMSNANKFTNNGTIALSISREQVEDQSWIVFRVTDTGIGMTPEQQAQIFQLFVQVDSSNTRRAGGTGLGLSISRRLGELMGGSLVLERSELNVGSTFTMRLPVGSPPTAVTQRRSPTSFPVPDMARDVAVTIEPLAKKNGNKLCVECPHEVGAMHADVVRVKQCLLNLMSNANKFTNNGTIALSINREQIEGRYWIVFRVTDTGIGMTPEQQEQLFQRFVQVDSSNLRAAEGTGLGLSISRSLSELMGGSLVLERSELNVGSTFTLRLPVGSPPTAVANRRIPSVLKPTLDETPIKILVIDDDRDVREMLVRQLSKEGFQVITSGVGEEALRLAREKHPQVITLDVMMPGMDGWAVLSALKSDPATADVPVVIVSIIDDKNLGYALGASDYLVKPIAGDRLADVLKRFCNPTSTGLALIAEDDPKMRELLRRVLEKEMWTVVEASDGREALDLMAQRPPSLILLDLMMPEMDGMEFLAELQHHPEWSNIPLVIITAKELSEEERMFLNGSMLLSNCVKRILKKGSFNREELLNQVHQLVARSASVGNKS